MLNIFDFWAATKNTDQMHPADRRIIGQMDASDLILDRYLPQPYLGPLKVAKIVFLYLSPGTKDTDRNEIQSEKEIMRCARQRDGLEPLPNADAHPNAWQWWSSRVKWLGEPSSLAGKIAILELGAYHSENGYHDLLLALPSSRAAVEWAQNTLFPDAMAGKKLVICLRSPKYWGMRSGERYGEALLSPLTTRNGYIQEASNREEIKGIARKFLM